MLLLGHSQTWLLLVFQKGMPGKSITRGFLLFIDVVFQVCSLLR